MNRLIICNSYYQLFVAIQLRLTLFKNDKVDLWLSDHSNNSMEIYKNLEQISVFDEVRYFQDKKETYESYWAKSIVDILKVNYGKVITRNIVRYDEILFCNYSVLLYQIMDYYEQIGHTVCWSNIEEGVMSYDRMYYCGNKIRLIEKLRKHSKRKSLFEKVHTFYCFFPELVGSRDNWNLIHIPMLETAFAQLKNILNMIFNYEHRKIVEKYIYFASSAAVDKCPYGEEKIVEEIKNLAGENELIIKLHPRDDTDAFRDEDYHIMRNSDVPWEVIQINLIEENHVFLSTSSGAFLNIAALYGGGGRGYFLFDLVENQDSQFIDYCERIRGNVKRLNSNGLCENIHIVNNRPELERIMKQKESARN